MHKTGVINDPLGQTHSWNSDHYFKLKFVLFSKSNFRSVSRAVVIEYLY